MDVYYPVCSLQYHFGQIFVSTSRHVPRSESTEHMTVARPPPRNGVPFIGGCVLPIAYLGSATFLPVIPLCHHVSCQVRARQHFFWNPNHIDGRRQNAWHIWGERVYCMASETIQKWKSASHFFSKWVLRSSTCAMFDTIEATNVRPIRLQSITGLQATASQRGGGCRAE